MTGKARPVGRYKGTFKLVVFQNLAVGFLDYMNMNNSGVIIAMNYSCHTAHDQLFIISPRFHTFFRG